VRQFIGAATVQEKIHDKTFQDIISNKRDDVIESQISEESDKKIKITLRTVNPCISNSADTSGIRDNFLDAKMADLNGDQYVDLLMTYLDKVVIYENDGTGSFNEKRESSGRVLPGGASSAEVADINQDGLADVLLGTFKCVNLYLNAKQTGYTLFRTFKVDSAAVALAADFLDGHPGKDLVVGCENGEILVYYNVGNLSSRKKPEVLKNQTIEAIRLIDLNSDFFVDILVESFGGTSTYYINDGRGSFSEPQASSLKCIKSD
jgi:hypothetical protein